MGKVTATKSFIDQSLVGHTTTVILLTTALSIH